MQTIKREVTALLAVAAAAYGMAAAGAATAGAKASDARPQYIGYRSFRQQFERTKDFADMGIPLRTFFAANTINAYGMPYCDYPLIWKGIKQYDWAALDAQVEDFLKASPNAEFICMIDLNTPYWAIRRFSIDSFTEISHAASNPGWIKATKEWMLDFIAYAEKKWGAHIRAYVLSGGCTSEWYEWDKGRTGNVKNAAWARWCKERNLHYGPTVPNLATLRTAAFENLVYDPAKERQKIDYWRFHNSVIADAILSFASAARKAIPAQKNIGVFYGYYYTSAKGQVSFGHLDYERVYASPDIDFFIAPANYSGRRMGGGTGSQLVHSTARHYGKRLMHEIDVGPHTQKFWKPGTWKTFEEDVAGNTREAAFATANGCSYYWFDMWGGKNGFYDDPALRARIAKLAEITRRYGNAFPHPADEVLLVADPESLYHVNEKDPKERAFGEYFRNALSKTGFPFDVCTLSDLKTRDISRTRVVVYPAAINVTPEKKELIEKKILGGGRTVVWCYAPGISDGQSLDVRRVKDYAGVPYATPGMSTTKMDGGWTSVYARDYKLYTPAKLCEIIAASGAHVWASKPCVVFANERFVAVHTKDGGEIKVSLPRRYARITDLLADKVVAENADSFTCTFSSPDTRLFDLSGND